MTAHDPAAPAPARTVGAPASAASWTERYTGAVMNTFGTPKRVLVRGEGSYVWDAEGRRYLDLLGGIAVNALGHAHPGLVAAVTEQLATLGHVSNFFATPAQVTLAERLLEVVTPGGAPAGSRVFLANSGAEANEAALKMTRRHRPGGRVLALEGAFHGRTMGALSLTHKAAYREPFEPLPGGVEFLPFGDLAALERALGDDVAALFVEPVQGEAGVRPLPPGYLPAARELTTAAGALLVLDEVQSGTGRTGTWMAHHLPHVGGGAVPDVVTLAKGLGGGLPIGATVALGEHAAGLLGPGQHGTTFGGNPVSAAAALTVLDALSDGLLEHVVEVGDLLRAKLAGLGNHGVAEVRGEGLLLAVGLTAPVAAAATEHLLEAGFIVNPVREDALRLAPPLILTGEEAASFVDALPAALDAATAGAAS
ncbi:acetylornithine transaminase [Georgenia muralis]|uniref:Acetylornithine aminotransferase n=1 Tax=Georgenia muralis TaxID=154117 RepID=A0A3N4Z3T7_9MICO|nr:acetylornithine transaminase [Georgenia muralis]RPF27959.1 acetylornithine aminotransferase [Georgenia muralis]